MFASDPIGLPGIAAFLVGALGFFVAVLTAGGGDTGEPGATRSLASLAGLMAQAIGIGIFGFGPPHIQLDPLGARRWRRPRRWRC